LRVNPRRGKRVVVDQEMEPHQAPMQRHTQRAAYRADCVCPALTLASGLLSTDGSRWPS